MVKKAIEVLCTDSEELLNSIEGSKSRVNMLKDLISRLQMQNQQKSEANSENSSDMQNPMPVDIVEAQFDLEYAQADSVVSSERIAVSKNTYKLLTLILTSEKAHEASVEALCSKSQARLHSQVFLIFHSCMTSFYPTFKELYLAMNPSLKYYISKHVALA